MMEGAPCNQKWSLIYQKMNEHVPDASGVAWGR